MLDGVRAVLRPGQAVRVLDLSVGGAHVEASRPMRPGSRVHVHVRIGERAHGISARVLRCGVASLTADGVSYRGALAFEPRWERLWEQATHAGYPLPNVGRAASGRDGHQLPEPVHAVHV